MNGFVLLVGTHTGVEVHRASTSEELCERAMAELNAQRAPYGVMVASQINDGEDYLVMLIWPGPHGMGLSVRDLP